MIEKGIRRISRSTGSYGRWSHLVAQLVPLEVGRRRLLSIAKLVERGVPSTQPDISPYIYQACRSKGHLLRGRRYTLKVVDEGIMLERTE
jgi:hypothetical protein